LSAIEFARRKILTIAAENRQPKVHGRFGLRLEFRDHVALQFGSTHIFGLRIGLAFR
jgi:hypothetical protein